MKRYICSSKRYNGNDDSNDLVEQLVANLKDAGYDPHSEHDILKGLPAMFGYSEEDTLDLLGRMKERGIITR